MTSKLITRKSRKPIKACEICGYTTTRLIRRHGFKCCPDCATLDLD